MGKLKERIEDLYQVIEVIQFNCNVKIKEIKKEISNIRAICPHVSITYHPDASGNNDSCYTCDECGEERKRFSPKLES